MSRVAGKHSTLFGVQLIDPGERKIAVAQELIDLIGLGLREAKVMVAKPPSVVADGLTFQEANHMLKQLESVGAKVILFEQS